MGGGCRDDAGPVRLTPLDNRPVIALEGGRAGAPCFYMNGLGFVTYAGVRVNSR